MGEDEEATLRTLSGHREIIDGLIERHHGRFVNSAGDSVLAEFASVVEAVNRAVEIQTALTAENANSTPERRMEFRIGVNLGDVMVEGEQIYGDGVNVAARLQSSADAGGIFISGTAYDQVENKLALTYEYLGEQAVKNIAKPVRMYRVLIESELAAAASKSVFRQAQHERSEKRRVGTAHLSRAALVVAGLLIGGGVVPPLFPSLPTLITRHSSLFPPEGQPPLFPFPDKPSLLLFALFKLNEG